MPGHPSGAAWKVRHDRVGFTLLELLIVLIIGGVLLNLAIPQFSRMRERRGVTNARDAFVWLAARARATALERGETITLGVDPAADRAWVLDSNAGDTMEVRDYTGEFMADVETGNGGSARICYSPRGFAIEGGSCTALPMNVTFTRGDTEARVTIQALGQVEAP